jgi:hypothetical protein
MIIVPAMVPARPAANSGIGLQLISAVCAIRSGIRTCVFQAKCQPIPKYNAIRFQNSLQVFPEPRDVQYLITVAKLIIVVLCVLDAIKSDV